MNFKALQIYIVASQKCQVFRRDKKLYNVIKNVNFTTSIGIDDLIGMSDKTAALTNTLKRTCTAIMGNGGVIRNMENLGRKTLPYKISKHSNQHTEANYFLLDVDISTSVIPDLRAYLHRDIDIVRPGILQKDLKFVRPCLEGECNFGELPNPDHERRVWKRKTLKKVNYTKADKTRLNYV